MSHAINSRCLYVGEKIGIAFERVRKRTDSAEDERLALNTTWYASLFSKMLPIPA